MWIKLIGVVLIILAFVVEFFWLSATFGTVIIGIVLLIFAPNILLLPFTFLFTLGVSFLHIEKLKYSKYSQNNHFEQERTASASNMTKYYEILECTPEDDFKTIKDSYKRLSRKFHPDAIEGKGLEEEFVAFATEKMKIINEAYSEIKKLHKK